MELGVASFGAITILAYLAGCIWKTSKAPDKWIPCVCGLFGCILGVIAYFIKVPDFPANDIINAAAIGVVSGFAATGINQIKKQLYDNHKNDITQDDAEIEDSKDSDDK